MVLNKYAVAILSLAVLVLAGFQAAIPGGFTHEEIGQLATLTIGGLVGFIVPLAPGRWAAAFKVAAAVATAVIAAFVPVWIAGAFTAEDWLLVIVAGVNVFATQVGVSIRQEPIVATKQGEVYNISSLPEPAPAVELNSKPVPLASTEERRLD